MIRPEFFRRLLCAVLFSLFLPGTSWGVDSSPYRAFYPEIRTISTDELRRKLFEVTLIDVRDRFEFDVVHISKSLNVPLREGQFRSKIGKLKKLWAELEIILVSSDADSFQAFQAARITRDMGMENVQVYDAGVFSWLYSYPGRTVLMGEEPARQERILPLITHQVHLISFGRFQQLAMDPETIVIDIRDIYQRLRVPKNMELRNITVSSLLMAIGNRIWSEKKLLIFDSDGSKLKWLQFFLLAAGYYDYYFLEGGLDAQPAVRTTLVDDKNSNDIITVNQVQLKDTLAQLHDQAQSTDFLNLVIGSIRFENISFISSFEVEKKLGYSREMIASFSDILMRAGLLRYFSKEENFVYQIDPLLAWKGQMGGDRWEEGAKQFHNRVQ